MGVEEFGDACVEAELDGVGESRISVVKVVVPQGGSPGSVVVGGACITLPVLEDTLELRDPNFRILSICGVGDGRLPSIQWVAANPSTRLIQTICTQVVHFRFDGFWFLHR